MENCSDSFLTAPRTRFYLSQQQNLSVGIVYAIISFFIVPVNSLLIFAFSKTKQLTNSINAYIMFLSLSDCLLIGAVTLPLESILHIVYHNQDNCILSNFVLAFSNFSAKLSGYFILLIGLDRFMNIKTEFKEESCLLKKLRSKCGSIILTCLCLFLSMVQGGIAPLTDKYPMPSICIDAFNIIIVISVCTLYIRIYMRVRRHCEESLLYKKDAGRVHIGEENTVGAEMIGQKSDKVPIYMKELTKTVLLILVIIAICYLPYLILSIWISSVGHHEVSNTVHVLHIITLLVVYLNSGLNACVILYRNEVARRYLSRKISNANFLSN